MTELWNTVKENGLFVIVSIGILLALWIAARIAEHFLPQKRKASLAQRASIIGIFAAIAMVLHILDFPLPFLAPGFYKLDFSEVPVLLCGFYLGPAATVACEGIKILLKLLVTGTSTAFVGDVANFVVGCSLVLPATIIYHIKKSRSSALVGMGVGTVCLTLFGSAFNAVYLIPKFSQLFHLPLENIIAMGTAINSGVTDVNSLVFYCVVPLNLLKGIVVSTLVFLLYKRVGNLFLNKFAR